MFAHWNKAMLNAGERRREVTKVLSEFCAGESSSVSGMSPLWKRNSPSGWAELRKRS
jgi:hypothetical protein